MITRKEFEAAQKRTLEYFDRAHIAYTAEEAARIEVADFGLSKLEETGLELLTYINTDRVCGKEMALFPGQTCPEHKHPTIDGVPGKEETFRCRWGKVYLYVSGGDRSSISAPPPEGEYTAFKEIILEAGDQYTIYPDTLHWFRGGSEGAVVSEFSTHSNDATDIFTDPRIGRATVISE